jgi:hypothetical protein
LKVNVEFSTPRGPNKLRPGTQKKRNRSYPGLVNPTL